MLYLDYKYSRFVIAKLVILNILFLLLRVTSLMARANDPQLGRMKVRVESSNNEAIWTIDLVQWSPKSDSTLPSIIFDLRDDNRELDLFAWNLRWIIMDQRIEEPFKKLKKRASTCNWKSWSLKMLGCEYIWVMLEVWVVWKLSFASCLLLLM